MMIEVDKIETYPLFFINYLDQNKNKFRNSLNNRHDLKIDEYIIEMFNDLEIAVFHCTNLVNPITVKEYGLLLFNSDKKTLRKILSENFKNKEMKERILIDKKQNRGDTVHFVFSFKLVKYGSGISPLLSNFGGEIATEFCYNKNDLIVKTTPYIIKFRIQISQLFYTNFLISNMAAYYYDNSIIVDCEDHLYKEVPSENILDIIDATKILNNLLKNNK